MFVIDEYDFGFATKKCVRFTEYQMFIIRTVDAGFWFSKSWEMCMGYDGEVEI
jgi:hypothetical protein